MDDARIGAAFRAVRIRQRLRQHDVADLASVSRTLVSLIERGHLDHLSISALRKIGSVLEIRLPIKAFWKAGDLDRLLNAGHSAMHESLARFLSDAPDWLAAPEVSFAIYGERGVIDILAYHPPTGSLLVIEIKTDLVDMQELIGTLDRKQRLAVQIARDRGWAAASVSCWLVVAEDRTNRRRAAAHRTMLRNAYPSNGHALRSWLRRPVGPMHAMSFWSDDTGGNVRRRIPTTHCARRPPADSSVRRTPGQTAA